MGGGELIIRGRCYRMDRRMAAGALKTARFCPPWIDPDHRDSRPLGHEDVKHTKAIGMVIPVLNTLNIAGKTITANALVTQRKLAARGVLQGSSRSAPGG